MLEVLLLLTGAAWAFTCWVAYDTGYDKGWRAAQSDRLEP